MAVEAKGQLGILLGIEDNMAAYRVLDVELRKVRLIPFTQLITHEGHYPFRSYHIWTADERAMPASFTPTPETMESVLELGKYHMSDEEVAELYFMPRSSAHPEEADARGRAAPSATSAPTPTPVPTPTPAPAPTPTSTTPVAAPAPARHFVPGPLPEPPPPRPV